jgi:hypothetical protein
MQMSIYAEIIHIILNDLFSSPNIVRVIKSRRMRWTRHVMGMGKRRGVYRVLVRKPEGKRQLGRPNRRWVDNIKMDLQAVLCPLQAKYIVYCECLFMLK